MNIIILTTERAGRDKFLFVGVDAQQYILVFSNLSTALEVCAKLEEKFSCKLNFVSLQIPSKKNFEKGVMESAPPDHDYVFVYENTSEFNDLLDNVGI